MSPYKQRRTSELSDLKSRVIEETQEELAQVGKDLLNKSNQINDAQSLKAIATHRVTDLMEDQRQLLARQDMLIGRIRRYDPNWKPVAPVLPDATEGDGKCDEPAAENGLQRRMCQLLPTGQLRVSTPTPASQPDRNPSSTNTPVSNLQETPR